MNFFLYLIRGISYSGIIFGFSLLLYGSSIALKHDNYFNLVEVTIETADLKVEQISQDRFRVRYSTFHQGKKIIGFHDMVKQQLNEKVLDPVNVKVIYNVKMPRISYLEGFRGDSKHTVGAVLGIVFLISGMILRMKI